MFWKFKSKQPKACEHRMVIGHASDLGNKDTIDHLYKEKGWPPETNV
jgi:hypothetical protein